MALWSPDQDFEWDIFLSYGWSGNSEDEGDRAWVSDLKNRLEIALRTPFGCNPKIFLDTEMPRTRALPERLKAAVDRSKIFAFVITPGSCRSNWCQMEIQRFLDRGLALASNTDVSLPEDRLLALTLHPVQPTQFPSPLRPLILRPIEFFKKVEGHAGAALPMGWDVEQSKPLNSAFEQLVGQIQNVNQTADVLINSSVQRSGFKVFLGSLEASNSHDRHIMTPLRRDLLMRGHELIRGNRLANETVEEFRVHGGVAAPLRGRSPNGRIS